MVSAQKKLNTKLPYDPAIPILGQAQPKQLSAHTKWGNNFGISLDKVFMNSRLVGLK